MLSDKKVSVIPSTCPDTPKNVPPIYKTRFFYNSRVHPSAVEAALARRLCVNKKASKGVWGGEYWAGARPGGDNSPLVNDKDENRVGSNVTEKLGTYSGQGEVFNNSTCETVVDAIGSSLGVERVLMRHNNSETTLKNDGPSNSVQVVGDQTSDSDCLGLYSGPIDIGHMGLNPPCNSGQDGLNQVPLVELTMGLNLNWSDKGVARVDTIDPGHCERSQLKLIYDKNYCGFEDKFTSSVLYANHRGNCEVIDEDIYHLWQSQVDSRFGFVPLQKQILPSPELGTSNFSGTLLQAHNIVKKSGRPNFLQARIPVKSQLKVEAWEEALHNYWDRQLLELIKFGFPLDFNRACVLGEYTGNHSSAIECPKDIEAYIEEELHYGALLGPFEENPIEGGHCSPFMTRSKPNSDRRRVIVDLSWPQGASVNAGIDKFSYLSSAFALTFPTVDDITAELKRLGRGALLYKVDVSRAFRHVKVDPGDYDLLGLYWDAHYVDSCVPFGTRHGSQIFQRLSDAVRFIMRQKGFPMLDYTEDYVGVGVPSVAHASYAALLDVMSQLGLTISQKKLVAPSTQVTCLGVLIDTVKGTVSIPPEKLDQINSTVRQWLTKSVVSKRQLQSILGLLLYVHKCVKPARIFINRMLDLLRSAHASQRIPLTTDFK